MPNYTKKNIHLIINRIYKIIKKIRNSKCGIYLQNSGKQTAKDTKQILIVLCAIREKPNA